MIAYVCGIVEDIKDTNCVVDMNGFGINVIISPQTASKLPGIGESVKLYTYTSVREDAFLLYGFLSRNELNLFKLLITVNGIGPKGAQSILSQMDADTLKFAICSKDVKTISKAPGIGTKSAERIILELSGKISNDELSVSFGNEVNSFASDNSAKAEAIEALCALGYSRTDCIKAINSLENIDLTDSGTIIKMALKKLF